MKRINYFWLKMSLISIGLFGSYVAIDFFIEKPWFGIRRNISDSLPFSFFLSTKLKDIKRHMYVSLEHPKSSLLIAKQIIGLPGDIMMIKSHTLYINEVNYGLIREKTRSGHHIEPIYEGVIPEGYVFVYAPHPDSYDSRYAEFGLILISQLKEKLWPIL